jgi:hypothetical protein
MKSEAFKWCATRAVQLSQQLFITAFNTHELLLPRNDLEWETAAVLA